MAKVTDPRQKASNMPKSLAVKDNPGKKAAPKKQSFGSAFAAARKAGKSVFTWNGKKYNTKTKDDAKKTERKKPPGAESKGRQVARKGKTELKPITVRSKRNTDTPKPAKKKADIGDAYKRKAKSKEGIPGRKKEKLEEVKVTAKKKRTPAHILAKKTSVPTNNKSTSNKRPPRRRGRMF